MKKYILSVFALSALVLFSACSNDDDNTPEEVNEEEVITTLLVSLVPDGGGTPILLLSTDLDGDGPTPPVVTVSGNLAADTNYRATASITNETEDPAENITLEVLEEADEHQMFYISSSALNLDTTYLDTDSNGNPLGIVVNMAAGTASTGTLNVVLRHEPNKPNDGSLGDAGGETDISVTFNIVIE